MHTDSQREERILYWGGGSSGKRMRVARLGKHEAEKLGAAKKCFVVSREWWDRF